MDFGVVGWDELAGSETGVVSLASDPETKQKSCASALGFRSAIDDGDSRSSKLCKTDDFSSSKTVSLRSNNIFSFSDAQEHQQMLSFSSPKSESLLVESICPTNSIPYFHCTSAIARNQGYNGGRSLNYGSMYGGLTGVRGPFTPSQWMELEHQALIYKYIAANVVVPSNLLMPIKKAFDSAGLSGFPASFLGPNALGWGSFHVGFSGNSDPEPGRCRRTDGKKWRCARDALADHKYCERHMNRGRHRSRKPVEGQAGQSVAGTTAPKLVSSSTASVVNSGAGISNQFRQYDASCLSSLSSPENALKSKQISSVIPKPQITYEPAPGTGSGLVSGDYLLNPASRETSMATCKSFGEEGGTESRLHHFLWPKTQPDQTALSWSGLAAQSDRTQLSISTPMDASNEKLTLSPLRLSKDLDPIQMGLGMSNAMHDQSRQANWVPMSWGSSMGGPLGEVLNHPNKGGKACKGSSALNLMTEGWENIPPVGSSPTGVLQKTSFGSVSTSSAGSSPRAESNRIQEGGSLCNDLLGQLL